MLQGYSRSKWEQSFIDKGLNKDRIKIMKGPVVRCWLFMLDTFEGVLKEDRYMKDYQNPFLEARKLNAESRLQNPKINRASERMQPVDSKAVWSKTEEKKKLKSARAAEKENDLPDNRVEEDAVEPEAKDLELAANAAVTVAIQKGDKASEERIARHQKLIEKYGDLQGLKEAIERGEVDEETLVETGAKPTFTKELRSPETGAIIVQDVPAPQVGEHVPYTSGKSFVDYTCLNGWPSADPKEIGRAHV